MQHIIELTLVMPTGSTKTLIHPIILQDGTNTILVDCGFTGCFDQLQGALNQHNLTVKQLTGLVLTHHDHDHMGTAAQLKQENPQLTIYASKKEAAYISAAEKPVRLSQAEQLQESLPADQQAFGLMFIEMLRKVKPIHVDAILSDNQLLPWCGGTRVLATYGHTPGHISLFIEADSAVIVGDALSVENGKLAIANPQFTLDMKEAERSMSRLLSLNAKSYYCYHGGRYLF